MLIGITRVRNEELIIKDTLDYYSEICDGGIYVYDDCSTDKTREIISTHPAVKGSIFSPTWDNDRARAEWQNRESIYQMAQTKQSDNTWFLYFDADERVELYKSLLDDETIDAIYLRLFDFYITPTDVHRKYNGDLIPLRDWIGPEYRDILMLFRKRAKPKWHLPDQREPDLQRGNIKMMGPGGVVRHYGKSISIEQWEETCRYYAEHFPMYSKKWKARKGKAVHDGVSDFGNPLIRWEDKSKDSTILIPLKQFESSNPSEVDIKRNHRKRRHCILLATNHLFGFTGSEITLLTIAQCLKEKNHIVSIYAKYINPSFTPLFNGVAKLYTDLNTLSRTKFDAAYVQHHTIALEVRHKFPQLPMVFASLGVIPFLEQPPIVDLNIHRYLAISEEVRANLIRKGIDEADITIFRNIVDSRKFKPARILNRYPQSAAIYSYKIDRSKIDTIMKACVALNINCYHIGEKPGSIHQNDLAARLNEADIVFTLGRGAIETMMCGKIPIIFDYQGGDGMVTPDNICELMTCNFSGRLYGKQYNVKEIINEIKRYNPENASILQKHAINLFDANQGVDLLVSYLEDASREQPGSNILVNHEKLNALVEMINITKVYTEDTIALRSKKSKKVDNASISPQQNQPLKTADQSTATWYDEIRNLLANGRSDDAIAKMEKELLTNPSDGRLLLILAHVYISCGRIEEAEKHLYDAISYYPNDPRTLKQFAILRHHQGKTDQAIVQLEKALALDPGDAEITNDLGALYYLIGEGNKASKLFHKAIELDDTLTDARMNLADFYAAKGQNMEAETLYKEILARCPNDAEALGALQKLAGNDASTTNRKSCPVCGCIAYHCVTKLDHPYYTCTNCESVFTPSIDPKVLITENQGNDGRHRTELDNRRLSHLTRGSSLTVQKVLDFGCGQGEYGKFLASKGIQCLEIDQDTELQLKDIPDESIDGINMVEVIEHLYDPLAHFRDFHRVLKPGGRLYVESSYWNGQDLETWEYLSPAIGHCLVHSERSLVLLAGEFNLTLEQINANCYLFEKPLDVKSDCLTTQTSSQTHEKTHAVPDTPKRSESKITSKYNDTELSASIIIPVFNQVEFTSRCLKALYQNTPLERVSEIIVVDNASSDGTHEFLEKTRTRYPKLKTLTNKENLLFAKACNQGADIAQGDYLVFLNNDTEPLPGWLDRALERFESDKSIGIIGIKLLYPDRTVQHCGIQFYRDVNPTYAVWPLHRHLRAPEDDPRVNVPEDVHAVTGACLFIRDELFRRIGGFEERYGMYFEDTDLCFKARRAGRRVFYEPGSVVIHHEGKSSLSRDVIDEFNAKAARLFYKLWKQDLYAYELEAFIEKEEGRYVYLSDNFWPEIDGKEIVRMHHILSSFPPCYVHYGGSGDALLLLSTFYDHDPEQTIVSISNSTGMMRSFFDAFPKLKKVYFIPFPEDHRWHFTSRTFFKSSDICLGLGATPTTKADYREWSADLDIFKAYGIQKRPQWATGFKKNRLEELQVTIQPRGSLKGMVGSKRNALDTKDWHRMITYLEKKGVKPIIIGTPDEAPEYPCLGNAIDKRSYSFNEQMKLIAASDFFIGADSWGKTFSSLAGIPTFVFHALRGEDLKNWKDTSDYVFLEPWEEITIVKDLKSFRESFNAAWQDRFPSSADLKICWEGSQLVHHSLALVNRELCLRLIEKGCEVSIIPYEKDQFTPKEEPRFKPIVKKTKKPLSGPADVHVRHQWPPDFNPPAEGHWVMIQPWEFGSIPQEWVRHMATIVDEIWVPSHYVRDCYISSGVPSERVFVVPNGVNIDLFNPDNPPYQLNTKKTFKFLFVGGTIPRKGIDILLDVYTKSFSSRDDVCLVIKDMGGQTFYKGQTAKDMITQLQADPGCPEIEYIEHTLDSEEIAGLYRACDCLVHPYRGEGFGLPIAEAMASGRPVIVTGHGAALDFCHESTSYLIPAKEMRLKEKRIGDLVTVDFPWLAEPDKDGLAMLMKHVATNREEAAAKGIQSASFIRKNFTWDQAADVVIKRVSKLRSKPVVRHSSALDQVRHDRHHHKERTSIVILTSNGLDFTKRCVESIQMHTPEPHEIIFVDSGSEDGTLEWLRNLVKENNALKLIENGKNLGSAKGLNRGIEAATGDYILLLHNDVVVTKGWLSGMIDQMKIYPDSNTGVVGPMTNFTSGSQLVSGVPYGNDLEGMHAYAADFQQTHDGKVAQEWRLNGFCMLIRRKVLDIIGGFDEGYGCGAYEIDDLCLRSHLAGYRHIIARDVFVHHDGSCTQRGITNNYGASVESDRDHFLRKWSRFVTPSNRSSDDTGYTLTRKITEQEGIEELLRMGEECFSRGEIKQAVRLFERVLWLKPKNAQALNNLGVIQWQLGNATSALNIFQNALAINPKDSDALGNLLQAATETGRFDLLKQNLLESVRKVQPENPDIVKLFNARQSSARMQ